ncbi:MAG: DNA polymerase IV [Acidobacteria bacterium]|nr:DNA polymerase IV [Acidobacteriota bacterium]MBV9146269.1 DNA polymerase IV [Acidobacteriota bacterium]MBV9435392.1 DNA polymerase IV [Acidobacteriota bacterium]
MLSSRLIFHLDMDAFFVSVEELLDPTLKGKPVIVGGAKDQRGVVAAASYAARKFGVHSAMPLRTAAKLCPDGIYLDGHPHLYREYSAKVHKILCQFSPKVEMASVDEAYLDMTGTSRLLGPPLKAAHDLHAAIGSELNLNCSIGIGSARVVAKIASDLAKPNGILFVRPGDEARLFAGLPVRKMPGIGKVTEARLHELGVRTFGDLNARDDLEHYFGAYGSAMAGKARGEDAGGWFDEDIGESAPKSISHEHTFNEDTSTLQILETTLARLTEMVARRLREQNFEARTIQLKLRYSDFHTITRAHSLAEPTASDHAILTQIRGLFHANWNGEKVRLLGVHVSGFDAPSASMAFDFEGSDRWKQALTAADRLRDKYGESAVHMGSALKANIRERTHENPTGIPGRVKDK